MSTSTISNLAPPPARIAAAVAAVRHQLAEAQVLERQGRGEACLAIARKAVEAARKLGYPPVHAEAMAQTARLLDGSQTADARDEAEGLYRAALAIAQAEHHDQLAAMIWSQLVLLALQLDSETHEAHERWHHAAAVRPADSTPYEQARLSHMLGEIYYREGKYAEAAREQRRAIDTVKDAPELPLELSRYYDALAKSLRPQGKLTEAIDLHKRAIATAERTLSRCHPDYLKLKMNYGLALSKLGKFTDARSVLVGALDCMAESGRSHSMDAGIIHGFLSELSYAEGRLDDASNSAQQSLQIYQRAKAPDHRMAEAYINLGNAELKRKHFEDALEAYELALTHRGHLGPDHYQICVNEGSIAEALVGLQRHDEAMVHVCEARRILGHTSARDRETQAWISLVHGEVLIGQSKPSEALVPLEQALQLTEGTPDPSNHAYTMWALARALHRLQRSPERVKKLAEQAGALFAKLGEHERHNYLAVKQFLKRLPPPPHPEAFP